MKCRHCNDPLQHNLVDLGFAPPSNAYLTKSQLNSPELTFPLKVYVCDHCWLVQTADFTSAEQLFSNDYAYFSSTSKGWLDHAKLYSQYIIKKLGLSSSSFVVEVASNDGYLLKNFIKKSIPCLGIEPTESTAIAAEAEGIEVIKEFFGESLAKSILRKYPRADLICGNNVYAHVPDINDFTRGLKHLLNENGTITLEFPHLLQLLKFNQFDTIYHEHFSYLSLTAVNAIFAGANLRIYDVEKLSTHGGSLRIYGCHVSDKRGIEESVKNLLAEEIQFGITNINTYNQFQLQTNSIKNDFLEFLISQKKLGKKIAAYGAAAKGNTLMNYSGIKTDLIDFVCDAAIAKQGKFMPGSHIPIMPPKALSQAKPDFVIILPWNISKEVVEQTNAKSWGAKYVTAIPNLKIFE